MKRAAGSESTDESDSDAEGPGGDAALPPGVAASTGPGGHAVPRASLLGGFFDHHSQMYHLEGGGSRAVEHPRGGTYSTGGHRKMLPIGPEHEIWYQHPEAVPVPGNPAHLDGVYGYGERDHADPRNPEHRPFQSAPTVAAYRQQFGTDPTGVSATNHELNAAQRANAESLREHVERSRSNAVRVDYGTGHREGPGGPARPYIPGMWPPHSHMVNVGADGHYYSSIQDYADDLHHHADTNDHVRDGRDDDHLPAVLAREEERTVEAEVNRVNRRRNYARRRLEEERKAMHEDLARKEASGYFQRHFR